MQKDRLNRFIQKYNLNGNVNSVKWTSKDDALQTTFVTSDKSLMGSVKVDNVQFDEGDVGVYTTDLLQKLLGVLEDDVTLNVSKFGDKAVSLKVKNGTVSVDYTLSDLSVIPDPPTLKRVPKFQTNINDFEDFSQNVQRIRVQRNFYIVLEPSKLLFDCLFDFRLKARMF